MKNRRFTKLLVFCIIITFVLGVGSASALGLNSDLTGARLNPNYHVTYHCNFSPVIPPAVEYIVDSSYTKDFIAIANPFINAGYSFEGWSTTTTGIAMPEYAPSTPFSIPQPPVMLTRYDPPVYTMDLYAVWRKSQDKVEAYDVKYYANYPIVLASTPINDGPYLPAITVTTMGDGTFVPPLDYEFAGWSMSPSGTLAYHPGGTFIMPDSDVKLYGVWSDKPVLNRVDHYAYMKGYPEGTFGQLRNMTRAEAVVMFSRLLTKQMDMDTPYSSTYIDLSKSKWAADAIGYMQQKNVLSTPAPSFRPNVPITRAEFADLAVGFENLTAGLPNFFSDVPPGHKYYDQINYAVDRGWLEGYPDGTFRPDKNITRAEVIAVVNRVLERYPDKAYINGHSATIRSYTDLGSSYWAYYNIMEASVGHYYTKSGLIETWTSLR